LALQRLDLDEVWWLVSPQNPLKPAKGMAPLARRLATARTVAGHDRRIKVSDIETRFGTAYTAETIAALRRRFPHSRFVWLMGSDNLAQIPHWRRWTRIFDSVPVAVFDRPEMARRALAGKAAQRYAHGRIAPSAGRRLAEIEPPAWAFFHAKLDPRSATEIRAKRATRPPRQKKETATVAALPARRRKPPPDKPKAPGLVTRILASLDDSKAEDIVTIDLVGKTPIADYMVIASGRSARQVAAMTEHLVAALAGRTRVAIEGKAQGDWVLIDAGDVIVNLFRPEIRSYYNLEKMWGSALSDAEAARQ
jgi:nicotinate-nucleotide adenylyltransferase